MIEVRVTGEREAEQRCPYCHDALAGEAEVACRIECPGCRTSHHLACIVELGRCTVRGCERPLEATGVAQERRDVAVRSRIYQEVQARIRERVKSFVRDHCRAIQPIERLVPMVEVAILQANRAMGRGALEEAAEWWDEVARLETLARPGDLAAVRDRVWAETARQRAADLRRRATLHGTLRFAALLLLGFVAAAATVIGVALAFGAA